MRYLIVIAVFMMAMALAVPADNRRTNLFGRPRSTRQQSAEAQSDNTDPEDTSTMTSKIMECRSILQQAGMINLNEAGKPTEAEEETEEPSKGTEEKVEEPMTSAPPRRNARRY